MGDLVTFSPNTPVSPQFIGRGSKLEHPDILPIFLGSYWPGGGQISVSTIMDALNKLAAGPYFDGLKQYGYVGPVHVRAPQLDTSSYTVVLPALAPGLDQANNAGNAVFGYISNLVDNDGIADVDDNHDLFVVVFLDPSNPLPQKMSPAGVISGSASGANAGFNKPEFLDDATRFQWAWINTASGSLASVTQTLSHELVEGISDPFGTGWVQTQPPPAANAGQIADVCNQAAIVNGVSVAAYWSKGDGACIVPTAGVRRIRLSQSLTKHEVHDGPKQEGFVDLGNLCAKGFFEYVERTYLNELVVTAQIDGYESPAIEWTINGNIVPMLAGTIQVPATWAHRPATLPTTPGPRPARPAMATLRTLKPSPAATQLTIDVGPGEGDVVLSITAQVSESFDASAPGSTLSTFRTATIEVALDGEEIVWGDAYVRAKKQCDYIRHLSDNPGPTLGPPRPGDPPELLKLVKDAIQTQGPQRPDVLQKAADLVWSQRPDLADALRGLAQRTV